jgi:hypothetical protein
MAQAQIAIRTRLRCISGKATELHEGFQQLRVLLSLCFG